MSNKKPRIWFNTLAKNNFTGYGGAGDSFVMELHRRNWPMVVSPFLYEALNQMVDLKRSDLPDELRPDVQIDFIQPYRQYESEFFQSIRTGNSMRVGTKRLLFTMFESKTLPWYPKEGGMPFEGKLDVVSWADDINDRYGYDALIVPSRWCADVFKDGGVKCPIYVVPLGVDLNKFPYLERPKDREWFTFLHQCFYVDDRKGGDLVVDAFKNLREKGELQKARLITKWVPFMCKFKDAMCLGSYNHILGMNRVLTQGELLQLLWLADFSMNPTSGEGWGLIPIEHMATGLPVAVSNSTGCADYVDPFKVVNFPINCFEQPNWFPKIGGMEMRPDPDHVEELMLYAYNHKDKVRQMGEFAFNYVRDNWTYRHATDKLLEVINAVC